MAGTRGTFTYCVWIGIWGGGGGEFGDSEGWFWRFCDGLL